MTVRRTKHLANKAATKQLAYAASLADMAQLPALTADQTPPEWIQLFPAGQTIEARDGRRFKNPDPQAVLQAFRDKRVDLAIDWEHAQDIKAPKGERAPASGWINALEIRAGSIWAAVKWTAQGAADVISQAYRYISPTFYVDEDGNLLSIEGAGLVNRPALELLALAREQEPKEETGIMDRKLLIAQLGLAENATDAEIQAALKANKEAAEKAAKADADLKAANDAKAKAEADAKAAADKLKETETQLQAARAGGSDLSKVVPRSEYDALATKVTTLETAAKKSADDAFNALVDRELDDATKEGKITPADRDFYKASCSTAEGLERFRKHMASKAASPIVQQTAGGREPPKGSGDGGDLTEKDLTNEQRKALEKMGISEEAHLKQMNAQRKAYARSQQA